MTISTAFKGITLPTPSVTTDWGNSLNNGPFADFDTCLGGIATKSLSNTNITLSAAESKCAILRLTGTLTASVIVTTASGGGFLHVQNATTGPHLVYLNNSTGTGVIIPQGMSTTAHIDATNGVFLSGARVATVGQVAAFIGSTIPGGWLKANGDLVSRTAYAALWTYAQASGNIQTDANWFANQMYGSFSSGDGSTTFRLPDLRGFFTRVWADNLSTYDVGRVCGRFQDSQNVTHTHTGTTGTESASHTHPQVGSSNYDGSHGTGSPSTAPSGSEFDTGEASNSHTHTFTTGASGGTEARPINVALMYCVAYL
jgi:microcystin-dependent protein